MPGESSRAQAGDKGSQVCSAQSADVELRTLQGAEQRLLASLEEVQPFDQAIFVAAMFERVAAFSASYKQSAEESGFNEHLQAKFNGALTESGTTCKLKQDHDYAGFDVHLTAQDDKLKELRMS